MKIAVVGWGALIWERSRLLAGESWVKGGPSIPICWTPSARPCLAIDLERGREISTHYLSTRCAKIQTLIDRFRDRGDTESESVGFVIGETACARMQTPEFAALHARISTWYLELGFEGALWRWSNEPAVTFH